MASMPEQGERQGAGENGDSARDQARTGDQKYEAPKLTFIGSLVQLVLKTGFNVDDVQPHTLKP